MGNSKTPLTIFRTCPVQTIDDTEDPGPTELGKENWKDDWLLENTDDGVLDATLDGVLDTELPMLTE